VNALITLGAEGEIEPQRNAVYSKGRKISGNAQGRLKGAVLINGSFLMDFDFKLMDRVLKNPTKKPLSCGFSARRMITLKDLGLIDIELAKKSAQKRFLKQRLE